MGALLRWQLSQTCSSKAHSFIRCRSEAAVDLVCPEEVLAVPCRRFQLCRPASLCDKTGTSAS